jgi:predicted NACHT family NTPase
MDLPLINWFDAPIKESIKSVFDGTNTKIQSLDIFNKYKNGHFELLMPQVSGVKILGMQHPVDLKVLYYPATVSTNIRRRIYDQEWKPIEGNENGKKAPALKPTDDGDSYISKNPRVVLLGGPGAGKTTFLKFMALAFSDKAIHEKTKLAASYLPIYLHFPQIARDNEDVLEAISKPLQIRTDEYAKEFYCRVIEKGAGILLLDSLDEVPTDLKAQVILKIKSFAKLYPKLRIVISCRTADYEQVFEDFSEVELARLNRKGVRSIVRAWFGNDTEKGEKLLSLLDNDGTVSSLTETPLLLSLLCIQFKNDLALPKRKTELYRRCDLTPAFSPKWS